MEGRKSVSDDFFLIFFFFRLKYHDLSDKQFPPVTNKTFPAGLKTEFEVLFVFKGPSQPYLCFCYLREFAIFFFSVDLKMNKSL